VPDAREPFAHPAADALRRRVGRDELGMLLLQLLELAHQVVELRIADLGLVLDVVQLFVMTDEPSELGDA